MSRLVQAETERFRARMPGNSAASALDPTHSHLTRWLDSMLHLVDVVLEDEGVDRDVRLRVVRGILYGSPNPADAEMRMERHEQLLDAARRAQPTFVVPAEFWSGPEGGGPR